MSKPFIDSNVVLYLLSGDTVKADKAQTIFEAGGVISVQVLNEVASVCRRKLKMPWQEVDELLLAVKTACKVLPLTVASHEQALVLAKRFRFSIYDANIVASALLSGAHALLSEDMQSGMLIDGLSIQNPFAVASSQLRSSPTSRSRAAVRLPMMRAAAIWRSESPWRMRTKACRY